MKLRQYLREKKKKLGDFAIDAGIDRSYLWYLMKGKRRPTKKLQAKLISLVEGKVEIPDEIQD